MPQAGVLWLSALSASLTTQPGPAGSDFVSRRKKEATPGLFWLFCSSFWDLNLLEGNRSGQSAQICYQPKMVITKTPCKFMNKRDKPLLNTFNLPFGYQPWVILGLSPTFVSGGDMLCKAGVSLSSQHFSWCLCVAGTTHSLNGWMNEWTNERTNEWTCSECLSFSRYILGRRILLEDRGTNHEHTVLFCFHLEGALYLI